MNNETIILSRKEVRELITLEECIEAVNLAFKLYGEGKVPAPQILGMHAQEGGFHIKAGMMDLHRPYFVAKTNANFPKNGKLFGLPTIQGLVIVMDAENGRLLAILDSIELTIIRTGAATAVAAKYLSKANSKTATIIGCGEQGRISIQMLAKVRDLQQAYVYDLDTSKAADFAKEFSRLLSIPVVSVPDVAKGVRESDIVVTCTTSKKPVLGKEYIPKGCFIAAVGADNEEKQELETDLMASSKVVTDITEQSLKIGELHHAVEEGIVTREFVYAELGEIAAGRRDGRKSENDVFIFDSTGMALQDVVSAALIYEKALSTGVGTRLNFNS